MTLRLIEGWDHLSATQLPAKSWVNTSGGVTGYGVATSLVTGRILGSAVSIQITTSGVTTGTDFNAWAKTLPGTYTTIVLGLAFQYVVAATGGLTSTTDFAILQAGSTNTLRLQLNSSGQLTLMNSGGTTIATGTSVLSASTWHYAEVKAVIAGASSTAEVHLDGATEIGSTTCNLGSTGISNVLFQASAGANGGSYTNGIKTLIVDDVYTLDNSGTVNTSFLGDVAVETIYPSADGAHTQWTPSSGTSHYSLVNEHPADGDTSFVSDTTVGDRDSYAFGDLSILAGTIYGVQTNLYTRKDNSGTRQICAVARPTTTDYDGSTITLGTSYQDFTEIRETNPDTSSAWTISQVNASEFGIKLVA